MYKCLESYPLNIIKKIKKDCKKKKACGKYQNLFKEKKGKKQQNGCESYKICKKMKNKSLLSIKQWYRMRKKMPYYHDKKLLF